MAGSLVLWIGVGAVALVPLVAGFAFLGQDRDRAGVSRSIAALERGYAAAFEVSRKRSLGERIGQPLARRLGNLGQTLTPTGAATRLQRQHEVGRLRSDVQAGAHPLPSQRLLCGEAITDDAEDRHLAGSPLDQALSLTCQPRVPDVAVPRTNAQSSTPQ